MVMLQWPELSTLGAFEPLLLVHYAAVNPVDLIDQFFAGFFLCAPHPHGDVPPGFINGRYGERVPTEHPALIAVDAFNAAGVHC